MAFVVFGLSFSFFDTTPTAHALDCQQLGNCDNTTNPPPSTTPNVGRGDLPSDYVFPKECSATSPTSWFTVCIGAGIEWIIRVTLLQFAGFALWISANLLDYVINVGILNFKTWAPDALYPLWQVVRQIISMFVVFSGLWLAFMYIINKSDVFKRYLPWVIIFGLFVNFSYPLTRAAIDLSNIVSVGIYKNVMGPGYVFSESSGNITYDSRRATSNQTAGAQLMSRLGLQSLLMAADKNDPSSQSSGDVLKRMSGIFPVLLIIAYILYATYIFFIAAGILMMRTLALSFVIVASPLLFVDAVIPKLGDAAQKLRQILFEQLAVSIVFMLMLYLSMAMTGAFKNIGSGESIAQIFNVLMMLIVLHIMLKVTKSVSGSVGQMAANAVGKVGGFATGAAIGVATGGAGLLARGTIGAAAARWSTSEGLQNQKDTFSGRAKLGLANMLANSSYDARNTNTMKIAGNMGGLSKGLGVTGRLQTANQAKDAYQKETLAQASTMTDENARWRYLRGRDNTPSQLLQKTAFKAAGLSGRDAMTDSELAQEKQVGIDRENAAKKSQKIKAYTASDLKSRTALRDAVKGDDELRKQMISIDGYLSRGTTKEELESRVDHLVNLNDSDLAKDVIKNDPFTELEESHKKEMEKLEENLAAMPRATEEEKKAYDKARVAIGEKKKQHRENVENLREELLSMYNERVNPGDGIKYEKVNIEKPELTIETAEQTAARVEEAKQQLTMGQDINDLLKNFMSKNPSAANINVSTPPQTQAPTQATQTAPANEKEATLVT